MEQKSRHRNKRVRSPNYPVISLEEAISKTKILWEKDT